MAVAAAGTAVAAVLLALAPANAVLGLVRTLSQITTGKVLPYSTCAPLSNTTPIAFKPIDVVDAKHEQLPLGEEWYNSLEEPTLVRAPGAVQATREFLSDWKEQSFKLRSPRVNCTLVPRSLVAAPECWVNGAPATMTLGELVGGVATPDTYGGFMSFATNYAPFMSIFDNVNFFYRNDLFLTNLVDRPALTAGFHANIFERSGTIQVEGHKLWLFMRPEDFAQKLWSFPIGAFVAPGALCDGAFQDIELTYAVTSPGDIISFPRAWPHFVVTLPGPGVMINFRADLSSQLIRPLDTRVPFLEKVSVIASILWFKVLKRANSIESKFLPARLDATAPNPASVTKYFDQTRDALAATDPSAYTVSPIYAQLCERLVSETSEEARAGGARGLSKRETARRADLVQLSCAHLAA
eukprot:CAMPEP_0198420294 /NCGR_PEP_ID=MMETSP1452-20131203/813_1 /TAXON_ID=1181717 /ORGANISM="Synchroma pusillum, Strain CCMP3072" /LENGTH=410 /DNA_ID=CAMNT_0044140449 /DNA_START=107 /DNA_END=1339 /DNA_ORIENTATION=+